MLTFSLPLKNSYVTVLNLMLTSLSFADTKMTSVPFGERSGILFLYKAERQHKIEKHSIDYTKALIPVGKYRGKQQYTEDDSALIKLVQGNIT